MTPKLPYQKTQNTNFATTSPRVILFEDHRDESERPTGQVVAKGHGIVKANKAETASERMRIVTASVSGMK